MHGNDVECADLRGGAALTIAGIVSEGKTTIHNIDYLLRGYESFCEKLNSLGTKISIEKEE